MMDKTKGPLYDAGHSYISLYREIADNFPKWITLEGETRRVGLHHISKSIGEDIIVFTSFPQSESTGEATTPENLLLAIKSQWPLGIEVFKRAHVMAVTSCYFAPEGEEGTWATFRVCAACIDYPYRYVGW